MCLTHQTVLRFLREITWKSNSAEHSEDVFSLDIGEFKMEKTISILITSYALIFLISREIILHIEGKVTRSYIFFTTISSGHNKLDGRSENSLLQN